MPRRAPEPELWTTEQVADYLGYDGEFRRSSALRQLRRWGIEAVDRIPGREGGNRYSADQIRARREAWDGRGRRTDLETN